MANKNAPKNRWNKKTYDMITIRLRKDGSGLTRDQVIEEANKRGQSVNGWITGMIKAQIQQANAAE